MKKILAMMLVCALSCAMMACSSKEAETPANTTAAAETAAPETTVAVEETKKALPVQETTAAGETETHYKATMVDYSELTHGKRIVILQNTLVYNRDGVMTEDTAPEAETISYQGEDVTAYAMTYTTAHLTEELSGDVAVFGTDGVSVTVSAEEFNGMYTIIDDFQSGNPAILYNPETETEIKDFAYAIMANGEGILSVIAEQDVNVAELLADYGWDATATYNLVATDFFYIPITPEDYDEGGLKGSLSGGVNASFPEMTIAMGKINDVVYVEQVVE